MNQLDLHAVPDVSDAEESAYEKAVDRITSMDGRALFESSAVDVDALLDAFGLPDVFDSSLAGDTWADMAPDEKARWGLLAHVLRDFAHDRLDERLCMVHADRI